MCTFKDLNSCVSYWNYRISKVNKIWICAWSQINFLEKVWATKELHYFFLDSSPKFRMLQFISALMLYSNSASNPILYNICNEQFRNGFKQYFKPCLKTFCPMGSCINEEYSNEAKELEYTSLKYSPRTRLSTISQISNTRNSLTQNGRLMSVSFDGEKTKRNKDSRSTSVWQQRWYNVIHH